MNALARIARANANPATVMAFLALVVSLGGTAWAAATINGSMVVDGSLTGADVADTGSIRSAEVSRLTGVDISDDTLTGTDVRSLTGADISGLGSSDVTDGALTGGDLQDASVGAADLALDSVGSDQVAEGAIGAAEIADGAITSTEVADGNITTDHIADGTVAEADLAFTTVGSAVTGDEITDGTITTNDIDDGTVSESDLAFTTVGDAVTSGEITDGTIVAADVDSGVAAAWGGRVWSKSWDNAAMSSTGTTAYTMTGVPNGLYLVTFSANVKNDELADPAPVFCSVGSAQHALGLGPVEWGRHYVGQMAITSVVTVNAGSVSASCYNNTGDANLTATLRRGDLVALAISESNAGS